MNTILLILLCVFEIAFAFTAITRKADKKSWQTGRLICNAGQLLLFLIMLIVPGIDMSFRFMGLFILLLIRIIIAFIGMMMQRKKEDKAKRPGMMIFSAVLSIVLISFSLVPSFVITAYSGLPVSGEYEVAEANAILIDESRVEEFEADGSKREVPIYFCYPANAAEGEKFPLVIFSHGAFGYNQSNFSTYSELASNGYVVINTEPYTTSLLSFDNEEHHFASEEARAEDIPYANNTVHDNAVCGFRTYIPGTGHMNYTDLPMFAPPLAKMLGTGSVDAEACMMTVNKTVLEFFDSFLKEKGEFIVPEQIGLS